MTHAALENPSDLFAAAAKAVLLADSPAWPFPVYANRQLTKENINRTEVVASGFRRASDHMDFANIANVSTPFYNHRRGQLAFTVVTARNDQNVTDNHAYAVGRLGYLCDRVAQQFTANVCSGLIVLDIDDTGAGAPDPDQKADLDRTTRHFEIEYIIPAAVYGAAT